MKGFIMMYKLLMIISLLVYPFSPAIAADVFADRVGETTTTTGTGTISLGGAKTGFRTFVDGVGDGNTCTYLIINSAGEWEIGSGTVADLATDTLTRDASPDSSSNSGSAVDFSAGSKDVYCIVSAAQLSSFGGGTAAEVTVADAEEDFTGENVETVLHEIQDTIDALPGGHDEVTLDSSATTGGMSLSGQAISNRAATNAQTGYATAAQIAAIEANTALLVGTLSSLSADGTYIGIPKTIPCGETIAFGDILYKDKSEDEYKLAKADANTTCSATMIAVGAGSDGGTCLALSEGWVREDDWDFTVDDSVQDLYLSDTTAGAITETPTTTSGHYRQNIGTIYDANTIHFQPTVMLVRY